MEGDQSLPSAGKIMFGMGMSKQGEPQKVATDLNKTFQSFLKTVSFHGRNDGLTI